MPKLETDTLKLFTDSFNAVRGAQAEMTIETTVTTAMIEAGVKVFYDTRAAISRDEDIRAVIARIYRAMHAARPK